MSFMIHIFAHNGVDHSDKVSSAVHDGSVIGIIFGTTLIAAALVLFALRFLQRKLSDKEAGKDKVA
jgi:hypothetical protein